MNYKDGWTVLSYSTSSENGYIISMLGIKFRVRWLRWVETGLGKVGLNINDFIAVNTKCEINDKKEGMFKKYLYVQQGL